MKVTKYNIISRIAAVITFGMMLSGCSGHKDVVSDKTLLPDGLTLAQHFDAYVATLGEWEEMNVPVKVSIASPMKLTASGRAMMRRGKNIYLSMRVMGMEVAVISIDNDSLRLADKWNKRYIAEPIAAALGGADVTVADIQDLLLGRAFVNGKGTLAADMIKSVSLLPCEGGIQIVPRRKIAGTGYSFTVGRDNELSSLTVDLPKGAATALYASPAETTHGRFMQETALDVNLRGIVVKAQFRFSVGDAKWSVNESVGWKAPKDYRKLDLREMLKSAGK